MREYELAFRIIYTLVGLCIILDQSFWQNQINIRIRKHLCKMI